MTASPTPRLPRAARLGVPIALGVLLVAAVVMMGWVGVRGALAYGHLTDAQGTARAITAQAGDPTAAAAQIPVLAEDTAAAHALTSDPVWRIAEGLPWLGPQLRAVSTVAASVDDVAQNALTPLTEVAGTFSVDALRPAGGAVDLSSFVAIQDAAQTANDGLTRAAASVEEIDRTPLVAPLREAVDEVADLFARTRVATDAVTRAATLLPPMLGADGARNYLVVFQNNAEWRSLGGIVGAMAMVHTDGGAMSLAAQGSSGDFPRYPETVLPLGDEVTAIYGALPGRFIQNVTQVPEFSITAQLAREMWAREFGTQVDGVISLDPVALSYLLTATGPVTLPTGDVLTTDNAVPLLLNEVYQRYPRPADQDAFFAAAAASVFDALAQGSADPAALVGALAQAGDERRLLLWSAHEEEQRLIGDTTLAGGLPTTDREASRFGMFLNDGTGSKMDYYVTADTQLAWDSCTIGGGDLATGEATLSVTVTNNAPADAATSLPAYITGGGGFGVPPGIARTIGYLYLPTGFDLIESTITGDGGFGGGFHDGRRVLRFAVDLAPGQTATATATVRSAEPGAPVLELISTPRVQAQGGDVAARCGDA
ncbi:DUF4012 domain-containing protein [Microbacterium sp. zg.B48]|uniref:DUF4012 domain-containing protein n=1 Tax=Microbacterium sp. zg.B48 TaxID=2969408 RepID=UPI00214C35CB|nr:DUF4012 domain-containing protein [Microbacterium sp. zg.B48]MCR2763280.1 DUF4012 domain-containing protein [Microbacterium sp. zg.B48]